MRNNPLRWVSDDLLRAAHHTTLRGVSSGLSLLSERMAHHAGRLDAAVEAGEDPERAGAEALHGAVGEAFTGLSTRPPRRHIGLRLALVLASVCSIALDSPEPGIGLAIALVLMAVAVLYDGREPG